MENVRKLCVGVRGVHNLAPRRPKRSIKRDLFFDAISVRGTEKLTCGALAPLETPLVHARQEGSCSSPPLLLLSH